MQIDERAVGNVTVLDLNGKLVFGEGVTLLKDKINSLLQQGKKHILLNLGEVPSVDSAGLGRLLGSFAKAREAGGELKLLHLTKRIHDLLSITKLLTVFDAFEAEADAVASFSTAS